MCVFCLKKKKTNKQFRPSSSLSFSCTHDFASLTKFQLATDDEASRGHSGSDLAVKVSISQIHASFAEDLYANVELVRLQILDLGIEGCSQKQSMALSGSLKILSQVYNTTLLDWEPLLDYAYLSVEASADSDSMGDRNKQQTQVV